MQDEARLQILLHVELKLGRVGARRFQRPHESGRIARCI